MAWSSIKDFTSGIREVVSPNYAPGTLQSDGTFRCYALAEGSLAPLPRRSNNYFFANDDDLPSPDTWLSPLYISGITARNPVFAPGQQLDGVDQNNTELLLGLEYFFTFASQSTKRYDAWRLTREFDVPGFDRVWREENPGTWQPDVRPKRMSFTHGRSNSAAPTTAGPIVTAFCVDGRAQMYPSDISTTTDSTRYLPGDRVDDPDAGGLVLPDFIVGHQGRVVLFPLALLGAGAFGVLYANNEAFYWTEPNDWTSRPDLVEFFQMVVGWESPTGYQVMQSLDSDQLLLLKSRGGGIMLQGDLDGELRADRHPSIRSPGLSMNNGTSTPLGLVYPVDGSGVWIWAGGDRAENLTPTMPRDFWRPPADEFYGHGFTQCDTIGDWVILPNNYLLDLQPEVPALWRLEDPQSMVIHKMCADWRGRFLYTCPESIENLGAAPVSEFDCAYPASSYQARLHPLAESLDSQVEVREVGVVASGTGRITVTVRTRQSTAGTPVTFDITDARYPTRLTRALMVRGSHIEFTVNSSSADPDSLDPAPTLHELLWESDASTPEPRF